MSAILVALDGAADRTHPSLGNRTPLEWSIPGWNQLPGGRWETIPDGCPAGTLAGVGTLLGLSPQELPTGRAWLEAVAATRSDAAFALRCNLVAVDRAGRILSPCAAGYSAAEKAWAWESLVRAYGNRMVLPLGDYRGLFLLGEPPVLLCPGRPPHQNLGARWSGLQPVEQGKGPLAVFSQRQAALFQPLDRPDRLLRAVLWSGSGPQPLPSFIRRHGVSGGVVTATPMVRGMALAMGMEAPPPPPCWTGDVDTDLDSKLRAALDLAHWHPFVLLHLNGADEASHRRDLGEKTAFLQRVAREVLPILGASGHRALLCTDHGTGMADGSHFGGDQPVRLLGWRTEAHPPASARRAIPYLLHGDE